MGFSILAHALTIDLALTLRTGLRILHFIGLALGLGAATILDLMILKFFIRGKFTIENWATFVFASRIITVGLIVLWVTGLGFLACYAAFDPAKLFSEKIWAKLAIVLVLTINGLLIHTMALPRIKARIGRPLMSGMSAAERRIAVVLAAVSAVSWYFPMALGALPQLNQGVPMIVILGAYGLLLTAAIIVGLAAMFAMVRGGTSRTDA